MKELLIFAPIIQGCLISTIKNKVNLKPWQIKMMAFFFALIFTVAGYFGIRNDYNPSFMVYIFSWIYVAQYWVDMDIVKKLYKRRAEKDGEQRIDS